MSSESTRHEAANAEILRWQTGYRVALALLAGVIAVALRNAGLLSLSPIADDVVGRDTADRTLAIVSAAYIALVLAISARVKSTQYAGRTLSTLMVVADLLLVFWLVFLLASPADYDRALLVSLFSLQLTHVYFGRGPALLMIVAIATSFLLINDVAIRHGAAVEWSNVLFTLAIFFAGALLVIIVQSSLHTRLATLVNIFKRAEEGDFSNTYDVANDRRPDAVTVVGRAYNRMRTGLATIVVTDPLSGCLNRRGFEQHFRRELARAARAQTDIALVAIDLDHFKQVNDTFGHLVGDRVIAESGELLRETARAGDVVARTGGEEFLVLAPGTSGAGAQNLAARIVEAFRRKTFAEPQARVTVSVGVVSDAVPNPDIAEDLRARADEALYAAKRSGRNRVVVWSHGMEALKLGAAGKEGR